MTSPLETRIKNLYDSARLVQRFPADNYQKWVDELMSLIQEEVEKEQKRIFGGFIMAGSAMTMYQTDKTIHWVADEMRKSMITICKIDEIDKRQKEKESKCEHEWEKIGSSSNFKTLEVEEWLMDCNKCRALKREPVDHLNKTKEKGGEENE